jgi:hypothetical protein
LTEFHRDVDQYVAKGMYGKTKKRLWQGIVEARRQGGIEPCSPLEIVRRTAQTRSEMGPEEFQGYVAFAILHEANWRLHLDGGFNSFTFDPCEFYKKRGLVSKVQFANIRIPIVQWQKDLVSAMQMATKHGTSFKEFVNIWYIEHYERLRQNLTGGRVDVYPETQTLR